jgi:4-alpha-glucanotransferase
MLPIGEDLGDVPDYIRDTLTAMGIPGMKVLRWENAWDPAHKRVCMKDTAEYNPVSMATIGVHDAETLRHWWETPTLQDIEYEVKAIFKARRDALSEDLGVENFDTIDQKTYDLIIENKSKLDYLTRKTDIYNPMEIEAFFNTPNEQSYYEKILKKRTSEKIIERQNAWEDLGFKGSAPEHMPVKAMKRMIELSFYSASILVVNPLSDLLGVWGLTSSDPRNDRINKPGIVDPQNWETRMPFTIAELKYELKKPSLTKPSFTRIQEARAMVESHGRLPYQMTALMSIKD